MADKEQTVIELMLEKREAKVKRMAHARKFINYKQKQKHPDSLVKKVREYWLAGKNIKGMSLAFVARLNKVPIATARDWIYKSDKRKAFAAQPNSMELARPRAHLNAVIAKYNEEVEQLRLDRFNAKHNNFSVAEQAKMSRSTLVQANASEVPGPDDGVIENVLDAILKLNGRTPSNSMEAREQARVYAVRHGMNGRQLSKLANDYIRSLNLNY